MATRTGTVTGREQIADATWAFRIEVAGAELSYEAGQSIDLTLVDPPHQDEAGNKRAFSLAAAPAGAHLLVASRVRGSAFKRSLLEAPLGMPVEIEGPFGSMTLPSRPEPVIMLAGGIGITPFRAIAEDALARRLAHPLLLVHSNRTAAEAPYLRELAAWSAANPAFRYLPTMTGAGGPGAPWQGERRRIGAEMLAELAPADRNSARYFAAGPDRFVGAVAEALQSLGVQGDRIVFELFSGY